MNHHGFLAAGHLHGVGHSIAATVVVLSVLVTGCSTDDDESTTSPAEVQHDDADDEKQAAASEEKPATPEDVLRAAHARGELFKYRSEWPRDVPLLIDLPNWAALFDSASDVTSPNSIVVYDCLLNELGLRIRQTPGLILGIPNPPNYIETIGHAPLKVPLACTGEEWVHLHLELWNSKDFESPPDVLAFSLPITSTDSVHDILDEHVDVSYQEKLRTAVASDTFLNVSQFGSNQLSLSIPSPPDAAIALDLEMRIDGELFHVAKILCGSTCQSSRRMLNDGYQRASVFLTDHQTTTIRRLDEESDLTITLVCNPELALYDVNAERFWKGEDIVLDMAPMSRDFWEVRDVR